MKLFRIFCALIAILLTIVSGCQIKDFVSPEYDIDANLPFITRFYSVMSMLKGNQNVYIDSLNNDVVLTGNVHSKDDLANNIKFKGVNISNNVVLYNRDTIISLKFDDSSAVRKAYFLDGTLNLRFNNNNTVPYNVVLRIQNLKSRTSNLPFQVSGVIPVNSTIQQSLNLSGYYIDNGTLLSNKLDFFVSTSSSQSIGFGSFDYTVTPTQLSFVSGRVKPEPSLAILDSIDGPLGTNAPNQPLTISAVKKAQISVRNYISTQIDFKKAYFYGYNKSAGTTKRLFFDYDGNGTLDSFYNVSIPARTSSGAFGEKILNITTGNSNILEFMGNVPDKIIFVRDQYINLNNQDVSLDVKDSIETFFNVEIPLRFQSTLYNSYHDTSKSGFTKKQLEDVDKSYSLKITTTITNAIALKLKAKVTVTDSSGHPLLYLTGQFPNQEPDSFYVVEAADVGPDGSVLPGGQKTKQIEIEINRENIQSIKQYGRVYIELKYITNPNAGIIRLKGDDYAYVRSQGVLQYRVVQGREGGTR
ncbi:MAG: hypothetical protein JST55_13275 [Bacteroidetes bacterium]|nr:hypothetical protein [Bacteroidota bacterium]